MELLLLPLLASTLASESVTHGSLASLALVTAGLSPAEEEKQPKYKWVMFSNVLISYNVLKGEIKKQSAS